MKNIDILKVIKNECDSRDSCVSCGFNTNEGCVFDIIEYSEPCHLNLSNIKEIDIQVENETENCIKHLRDKGYSVVKITKCMQDDMNDCERCSGEGEDKECMSCSCSICIMQH